MAQFVPQYNLFVIIDKIIVAITIIFWVIILLSVFLATLQMLEIYIDIEDLINTINIIISLFFIVEIEVEYILIPQADSKRRDDFIDNSFGSAFSPSASVSYFD